METPLTQSWFCLFVKAPFDRNRAEKFNRFSATESQKIIVDGILGRELDLRE